MTAGLPAIPIARFAIGDSELPMNVFASQLTAGHLHHGAGVGRFQRGAKTEGERRRRVLLHTALAAPGTTDGQQGQEAARGHVAVNVQSDVFLLGLVAVGMQAYQLTPDDFDAFAYYRRLRRMNKATFAYQNSNNLTTFGNAQYNPWLGAAGNSRSRMYYANEPPHWRRRTPSRRASWPT